MSTAKKTLTHRNVLVRAGSLWILCFAFLITSWLIAYYFLPYEMLKGTFPSAYVPLGDSFLSALFAIFSFNLVVACGLTAAINLLSAKSVPAGYLYPMIMSCILGILRGTDSFAISQGGRLFLGAKLLTGAGLYEITAYVFIAAATARLTLWNQTGWLSGRLERVNQKPNKLTRLELLVLMVGVLFLFAAAIIEANGIMSLAAT